MSPKKDNSTIVQKIGLRRRALSSVRGKIHVLETHGGNGRIGERIYDGIEGVVIEKDAEKAGHLAMNRPTWRVYQGDCVKALAAGLADDVGFNYIDIDPYGSPFPVLRSIFQHPRCLAQEIQVVVNDGLRQKVKLGGAWNVADLESVVARFGNDLYPHYIDVAKMLIDEIVDFSGYTVAGWTAYYTGHHGDMTHYWARLTRDAA